MVTVLVSKIIDLVLLKLRYRLELFSRPQMSLWATGSGFYVGGVDVHESPVWAHTGSK